jgi:hypothetical protein
MPNGHLSGARRASCKPGGYSLLGELLRTPCMRTSQNSINAKFNFREFLFHALG